MCDFFCDIDVQLAVILVERNSILLFTQYLSLGMAKFFTFIELYLTVNMLLCILKMPLHFYVFIKIYSMIVAIFTINRLKMFVIVIGDKWAISISIHIVILFPKAIIFTKFIFAISKFSPIRLFLIWIGLKWFLLPRFELRVH